MKSIHPVLKFIGIFVPAILLAFFYRPVLNLSVFAACLAVLFASRVNLKSLLLILTPVLLLALGMFATGYHFQSGAALGIRQQIFTDARLYNGLQLSSRVLAFAGLGMLFALTTDRVAFIRALEQQFRLPPKLAYGILAAWGMLPNMTHEYKKTHAAFRARGLRPRPVSPALLTPLLVKSVRWSEALAAAMESKGFGEGARTHYRPAPIRFADVLFPVCTSAGTVIALLVTV